MAEFPSIQPRLSSNDLCTNLCIFVSLWLPSVTAAATVPVCYLDTTRHTILSSKQQRLHSWSMKTPLYDFDSLPFLCLTFQLCNMFACIVGYKKKSTIFFLSAQYGSNFYCGQNTIESTVNSLCRSIFVRIKTVLGDIFTKVLT